MITFLLYAEHTESAQRMKNARKRNSFAEPAIQDGLIGIDAAVAEKRPVAARVFTFCGIAFDDEDFFFVVRGLGDDLPEWIRDERISPKFETNVTFLGLAFESHAIYDRNVHAIGYGV